MRKINKTNDVSGREIQAGDTVTTLSGDMTGKVCDICSEAEVAFVRVRPLHQSYGKGMWHAADQTMWLSAARRKNTDASKSPNTSKPPSASKASKPPARKP